MIWVSWHSKAKKYHTQECHVVQRGSHFKQVTNNSEIEHYKNERSHCKYCSDTATAHKNTPEGMHYTKLLHADPDDIQI